MCEFCLQHGEGQKWYLEAKNYSDDLLSDLGRRKFIQAFFQHPEKWKGMVDSLTLLDHAPGFVKQAVRWGGTYYMKKNHYGQVVPLEDIERIFAFVNSITRVACFCRHATLRTEKRYCYAISLGPNGGAMGEILRGLDDSFLGGPESKGMDEISKEEALVSLKKHEKEGLCHSVWTFQAPFIGGICNCDRSDCLAMQSTVNHGLSVMFRSEYVVRSIRERCRGCRQCMRVCQFGALGYSASNKKIFIDPRRCYGCGICRSLCRRNAIELVERSTVPAAAQLW